jgi:hypothetical protein
VPHQQHKSAEAGAAPSTRKRKAPDARAGPLEVKAEPAVETQVEPGKEVQGRRSVETAQYDALVEQLTAISTVMGVSPSNAVCCLLLVSPAAAGVV